MKCTEVKKTKVGKYNLKYFIKKDRGLLVEWRFYV